MLIKSASRQILNNPDPTTFCPDMIIQQHSEFRSFTDHQTANVIALHKKGSKKNALNYRPVSLTCILCKIYEQFIKSHVLSLIERKISADQHGFVYQKSCLSNILETIDTIVDMLEEGHPVDVFYFDFCKAFDSVPHYRLLTKLENYGITGSTLKIIENFLKDRTMRTVVRGNFSSLKKVLSGVPQGSVLGPLLFVLFINDLPSGLDNISKLFADDLKLICNADKVNCIKTDLRYLKHWEQLWLLKFNASKCKVMHLNYNGNRRLSHVLDDTILDSIESEKDLGIFTDCDLDWKANIRSCIKDANKMIIIIIIKYGRLLSTVTKEIYSLCTTVLRYLKTVGKKLNFKRIS